MNDERFEFMRDSRGQVWGKEKATGIMRRVHNEQPQLTKRERAKLRRKVAKRDPIKAIAPCARFFG